jgi:PEP-CTERM motif
MSHRTVGSPKNQIISSGITHHLSAAMTMRGRSCICVLLSFTGFIALKADVIEDPLHGCFVGTACSESTINGTSITPTVTNPLPAFTFTDSPGPITGDLLLEILIPNDTPGVTSLTFAIGATQAGPTDTSTIAPVAASLVGQWSSGVLASFLGLSSASPPNPLSAFLIATQFVDPAAGSYYVYQVDLGTNELQKTSNATIPVFSLSGSPLPAGSVLTAFVSNGSGYIATASSGGLFEQTGPPATSTVPEPSSILLLAIAAGAVVMRRRSVPFRP